MIGIGIVQMKSSLGKVESNLKKACREIKEAKNQGADIVILPELFNTGYHLEYLAEQTNTLGSHYYEQTIAQISSCAKENNVYVLATIPEEGNLKGVVYNSTVVFDREGKKMGSYQKSHLFALERFYFKTGQHFPVFQTDFGKIGIAICYDIGFPEVARILTLKGAEIIVVPSAWRIQDEDMWDLNLPQRALENLVFVTGVNAVLDEHDLNLFGKSKVYNPRGQLLEELPKNQETTKVVHIDMNDINDYRNKIDYLKDRNPHIYQLLTDIEY